MHGRLTVWLSLAAIALAGPASAGAITTITEMPGSSYVPAPIGIPVSTVVTIGNQGATNLVVSSVTMTGNAQFTVSTPALPVTLASAASIDVTVSFTAQGNGGLLTSALVIVSDDPTFPTLSLPWEGCAGPPVVAFDPPTFDFGVVAVGFPLEASFKVGNAGCTQLDVTGLNVTGDFFLFDNFAIGPIDAGKSLPFQAWFGPLDIGPLTGTVTASSNAPTSTVLALSGIGTHGYLEPSSLTFDFFSQVGKPATQLPVLLTNNSAFTVDVQSVQFSDPALSLVGGAIPPFSVAPGANTTVEITCTPGHLGQNDGTVTFLTSGESTVITVTCTGGPTLYVGDITEYAFGPVPLGVRETQVFYLGDFGLAPIAITSVTITGPGAADFVLEPMFMQPRILAPGETLDSVTGMQFTPSQPGPRTATLTIASDDPNTPTVTIALGGFGFDPELALSANRFDFGDVVIGLPQMATINATNNGASEFVARIDSDFGFLNPFSRLDIPAGATIPISVQFFPEALGPITGTVTIHVTEPPLVLPVTANVVAPTLVFVEPDTSLDLGIVPLGETSAPVTLTLMNQSPQALPISRIATTNLAFVLDGAPAMLGPGKAVDVTVTFTAELLGPAHAQIKVYIENQDVALVAFDVTAQVEQAAESNPARGCAASRSLPSLVLASVLVGLRRRPRAPRRRRP